MAGKVLLPLTEFQNRIPKCHWSCSWKQLHVCFLLPFPFQTDNTLTEQQPRVQRQGRFLLSCTNHADNLQELGSLSEVTEGTPPLKNTGISHSNWEQLCVPLASVQHPQSPVSIDSAQWRTTSLQAAMQAVNQTHAVSRLRPVHPPQLVSTNITGLGTANTDKYCLPLLQNLLCIIIIVYKRT